MNSDYQFEEDGPTQNDGDRAGEPAETRYSKTQHHRSDWIGPYKLLQQIGEGGMGTVWMAEQEEPVRRRVALKLVRADVGSRDTIARFEAERQAVALMDHQNIARFFDVGTTDSGAPYFAMELVKGIPITAYCDKNKLSVRERLELMIPVCHAIQHAHQKGIIHRDIKPSNILVTLYDGKPVAKVIDFGLAKALDQRQKLTDKTVFTEYGKVVGTLQYMSPEQAEMNALDVDTRTDIYSLGVILYELLAGSTPVQKETVNSNVLFKVLEIIREKDPPAPSVRFGESTKTNVSSAGITEKGAENGVTLRDSSKIISRRKTSESELEKLLKRELDWIVMKALEKDRTRRYETPNELAADIKRFLDDEPILARPQSTAYKIKRFVRRNKGWVAAAATISALLVAGVAGTTNFAFKALAAREEAVTAQLKADKVAKDAIFERDRADKAAAVAKKSEEEAKRSAEIAGKAKETAELATAKAEQSKEKALQSAKRAADILKVVTDSFESANPLKGVDANLLAKDVLLQTREILDDSELDDQGKLTLLRRLTALFITLGEHDAALASAKTSLELTRKLDPKHPELYIALSDVAHTESQAGNYEKGIKLYKETLALIENQFNDEHVGRLSLLNGLGQVLSKAGKNLEAIPFLEQAVEGREKEYGLTDFRTINSMGNLGMALSKSGNPKGLEKLKESLKLAMENLHDDHPFTLAIQSSIASHYHRSNKLDEAKKVYLKLLTARSKKLGKDHPTNIGTRSNIALIDLAQGKVIQSLDAYDELVALQAREQGEDHPEAMATTGNRAIALTTAKMHLQYALSTGDYDKAQRLSEALIRHQDLLSNEGRTQVAKSKHISHLARSDHDAAYEALKLWKKELENLAANQGDSQIMAEEVARVAVSEAACHFGMKRYSKAMACAKGAITMERIGEADRLRSQILIACCDAHGRDIEDAIESAAESFILLEKQMETLQPSDKWYVVRACERLVQLQDLAGSENGVKEWNKKLELLKESLQEVYLSAVSIEKAEKINLVTWDVVKLAPTEGSKRLSGEQLREMRKVCAFFPTGMYMNTLALAEFRTDHYREAIAASKVSLVKLTKELKLPAPFPGDYGVIAASHLMLGEKDEAGKYFELMNEGFKSKRFRNDVECIRIVSEIRTLFESEAAKSEIAE